MSKHVVDLFWEYINNQDYDKLYEITSEDTKVWFPNTKEMFKDRESYIAFNKRCPFKRDMFVDKIYTSNEDAISLVRIYNKENDIDFRSTAFFKIKNDIIQDIVEYWGEEGEYCKRILGNTLSQKY